MYRMLRAHPQLHMPRKEPSFFVPELLADANRYSGGIDDYLSLFDEATPEQLIGEATTWYLWSQTAARRIAEVQPQARIVAILREPASFLRSLHLQFLRSDVETEPDLRKAMALERHRGEGVRLPRNSTRPQLLAYSEHVRYVEQLRRYHDVFPAEQILVLIYDDFRADNEGTVRQVLRFLNVDAGTQIQTVEANLASSIRSPRFNELVRSLYMGRAPGARAAKGAIKAFTSQRVRHHAMAAVGRAQSDTAPPPDVEVMRELRLRFRDEVTAVGDYLHRDLLTFWKYDDDVT
jgi:Sulfotransferase family